MAATVKDNPDALPGAPSPRVGMHRVDGTHLYAEVRGSGPAVLLVGAADEDAEFYRPIAERLAGRTAITYDRRGTSRSGRDGWPGGGSRRHADDAAGLLAALGITEAAVFGASAGGIVALRLALLHPDLISRALIFEPGYFRQVPGGAEVQAAVDAEVDEYLVHHPGDWVGAVSALSRAIAVVSDLGEEGFFTPPEGREWYAERGETNAESLIREDLALTREEVGEADLAAAGASIRFAYGALSLPVFRDITTRLAGVRGDVPDRIDEVGHGAYYNPEAIASYILAHTA